MACCKYFFLKLVLIGFLLLSVGAEEKLRLCVQEDVSSTACSALERGDSPLKCERVIDSAECAIKLAEKKADFGMFTADELLLTHHFYPVGVAVVAQLKRQDSDLDDQFEFQSVVVVPKSYQPSANGFGALVGAAFCHPGFSKTQMWNDHVLKYFEQKVMNNVCRKDVTVAENEIINLRDFFKKACRPGEWVSDEALDKELKRKYPELCELCDDKKSCRYFNSDKHGHMGALDCLTSGRGQVAYASFHYVREYFSTIKPNKLSNYQFLCENGTTVALDSKNPCTWFKQPWNAILAREEKSSEVVEKLQLAQSVLDSTSDWKENLHMMLFKEVNPKIFDNLTSPSHYLSRGREVALPQSDCGKEIRWCTIGELELNKCKWLAAAALTLGIKPAISCLEAASNFECFVKISNDEADIITIDSNYGHLARKVYGLSPLMYCETQTDRNSFVVGVIRESATFNRVSSLKGLKDSSACFPEYGGIAWLSFINAARDHGVLPDSCKYPQIVANLLSGACTPGFVQDNHSLRGLKPKLNTDNLVCEITQEKLCSLCPIQDNGGRCEASDRNPYYGDKGALQCLRSGGGDIAFLEVRNFKALIANGSVNASEYRILCKNGTLADHTGFDVDDTCAFSVTIDSEVVSRRNRPKQQLLDTTLTLLKIEKWLGYRGDSQRRAIRVYDRFNGTADLLFKDSTSGLVSTDSEINSVLAYKELFRHVDACSGVAAVIATFAIVFANFVLATFL